MSAVKVYRNSMPDAPRFRCVTLHPAGPGGRVQRLLWLGPIFVRVVGR